ncbi:MAG: hypothetical protein QXJ51_03515 [Sulfolobales archaeon]
MSFEAEILGFEVSGECEWIDLELADGSNISVKPYIAQIARIGSDPNTGAPVYAVGASFQIRYLSVSPHKKPQTQPEFIGFKSRGECQWLEVKIEDGSILKVKPSIVYVMRVGFDPMGVPQYMVQIQTAIQILKIPKELIRRSSLKTSMHT